ncbi:unnamed protein product, partial [Symbiodinium pilosum]
VANEEGIVPDLQLYKKAANACREAAQWKACTHILRQLGQAGREGLEPDVVIYGTVMCSAANLVTSTSPWDAAEVVKWQHGLLALQGAAQDGLQLDPSLAHICISACGQ